MKPEPVAFILREPLPGDIGWVIQRHGALYAREYGWNQQFEALVAEVAGAWLRAHDPLRERGWIVEMQGEPVGSVFLMRGEGNDAKLRLMFVEPQARGMGIGAALVERCIETARGCGYEALTLWTTSNLDSARRLYEAAGFRLVSEESFDTFGPVLLGQHWRLPLR